jgi:hypothetical protein
MIEIRFDKTKDEVALLIWFLVDHSVYFIILAPYPQKSRQFTLGGPSFRQTDRAVSIWENPTIMSLSTVTRLQRATEQ